MSLDATNWAWRTRQKQKKGGALKPLKKLVLLSLSDRAGEDHQAYPSMSRLVEDTEMDRKTVLKIIDELIEDGLIIDTGERKGRTKQVKVYQLMGINGRESIPTTVLFNDENEDLKSPNSGTVPLLEQYQQFHERVPTFRGKGTNVGTRNLLKNLFKESKNKKDWICFEKLREEIFLIDDQIDFETLKNSKWIEREKRAFEIYNAEKDLCDDLMIYHFADWLLNAKAKYEQKQNHHSTASSVVCTQRDSNPRHMTQKQISMFALKLANDPEFSSKHAPTGWSLDRFVGWVTTKLADPKYLKDWMPYLRQVGFTGEITA